MSNSRLPLFLCLASALLPFVAVQISYLLAAQAGTVPWCFPYIDSCTSISATGRSGTASYVFRAAMLPASTLIAGFWWLHLQWLHDVRQHHSGAAGTSRTVITMAVMGWVACLGLVLYVSVLGEIGQQWRVQRRVGTILFFSFTFLSQLLLAAQLRQIKPAISLAAAGIGRWMLRVCVVMLCVGVFSVLIQAIDQRWHDAIEDAVEWQLALLLQINFLLCAGLWRRSDWQLRFDKNPR